MNAKKRVRLLGAVETSIEHAALRPDVPVPDAVADIVAAKLAPAVLATPELQHLANEEPWYRSRVTWGAIISTAIPILGAVGIATDWIDPDEAAALGVALGTAIGGAVTLYGRWKARRPIGR